MADRIRWVNKGGTHRLFGRIIKPNEKFLAFADEIPVPLRGVIVPVDPIVVEQPKPVTAAAVPVAKKEPAPPPVVKPEPEEKPARQVFPRRSFSQISTSVFNNYSMRERSPGWFDVVDSTGKVVNEQPQTEQEAKDLIKRLE